MTYYITENGMYNEDGIINLYGDIPEELEKQFDVNISNSRRIIDYLLYYLINNEEKKIQENDGENENDDWSDVNSNFSIISEF